MTIELRDAQEGDRAQCLEMLAELNSAVGEKSELSIVGVFNDLLSKERGQIVIAEEDSIILGMATVSYNIAMRYAGEYCQLEELIVTKAARGKRLRALLMEKFGFTRVGSEMRQPLTGESP